MIPTRNEPGEGLAGADERLTGSLPAGRVDLLFLRHAMLELGLPAVWQGVTGALEFGESSEATAVLEFGQNRRCLAAVEAAIAARAD